MTRPSALDSAPARLNAVIDRALLDRRIVGTVVLAAYRGQVIFERATGLADREAGGHFACRAFGQRMVS